MRESIIEKHLKDEIKDLGGHCEKFTSPSRSGVPDQLVLYNGVTYHVELKQERGRLSHRQLEVKRIWNSCGITIYYLWSIEDVDNFIKFLKEEGMKKNGKETYVYGRDA